jgi:hypothetical protein
MNILKNRNSKRTKKGTHSTNIEIVTGSTATECHRITHDREP